MIPRLEIENLFPRMPAEAELKIEQGDCSETALASEKEFLVKKN